VNNDTKKIGGIAVVIIIVIAAFLLYDPGPDQDLKGSLDETPELSTLLEALESTGVLDSLEAGSEYTIFAPTDDAFDSYDTELYGELLEDPQALDGLLRYHIVEGKHSVADISKMGSVTTLEGEQITISTTGKVMVNDSEISADDEIECKDGYIIFLDDVLIPPTVESTYIDLTITDALGREVYIKKVPERIVTLASSATETLYAIGAEDLVVGRDKYSTYPETVNDIPEVGSAYSIALEEAMNLEPDLVITWYYGTSTIESLEQNGVNVLAIGPSSVQDVLDQITLFGEICGHEAEADAIVQDMQATIDEITSYASTIPEEDKVKVYYELSTEFKSVNNQTFTGQLIEMAGGINIAGDQETKYPVLSSEWIIDQDPNFIVVNSYGATIEQIKSRNGWNSIDAVINDKVYAIESNWVSSTPRLVHGLKQFAKWFYPEHFS